MKIVITKRLLIVLILVCIAVVLAICCATWLNIRLQSENIPWQYSTDNGISDTDKETAVLDPNDADNNETNLTPNEDDVCTEIEDADRIEIAFVGDILLASSVGDVIKSKGTDYIFGDTVEVLRSANLAIGNLECAVSLRGSPEKNKQYLFRAMPDSVKAIANAGIHAVSLANNHVLDFGLEALEDTFENLKLNGIKYVGAGHDVHDASAPIYIGVKGAKVALVASSHVIPFVSWTAGIDKPGVASAYNPTIICEEISKARKKADIVIAYLHWGIESSNDADPYQRNLAKRLIDSGADIVIGTHPHVVQGLEYYKDGVIAYSLGNFVFTNIKRDTMILKVSFDKNLENRHVEVIPCEIKNFVPYVTQDKKKSEQFFKELSGISYGVTISDEGLVENIK